MNKKATRYTPFQGKLRMPLNEFCEIYNVDLNVVMRRMNLLFWEDFDAIVIPQNLGDIPANKIRRILNALDNRWSTKEIVQRFGVQADDIEKIESLSDYYKKMFLEMDNYFFLNPQNININKIFKVRGKKENVKNRQSNTH